LQESSKQLLEMELVQIAMRVNSPNYQDQPFVLIVYKGNIQQLWEPVHIQVVSTVYKENIQLRQLQFMNQVVSTVCRENIQRSLVQVHTQRVSIV